MKIYQENLSNCSGFFRKGEADLGVDEDGNLANGYQHHDALWWDGRNYIETRRPESMDFVQTMNFFNSCFGNLANNIVTYLRPKFILELGSGSGLLCSKLRGADSNIVTVSVDANRDVSRSPYIDQNHFCARTDRLLGFRDENKRRIIFDVVISLDHIEHISPEGIGYFMENIKTHTKHGSKLIFSSVDWKYPEGEHSHIHCNAKPKAWWVDLIGAFGFSEYFSPFPINRGGYDLFMTKD